MDRIIIRNASVGLLPLKGEELDLFYRDFSVLFSLLGLSSPSSDFRPEILDIIPTHLIPALISHPGSDLFICPWLIIDLETMTAVGEIGCKGPPDDSGMVEIGYDTFFPYRSKGYSAQALALMISRLRESGRVKKVKAETETQNTASQNVLMKNGFELKVSDPQMMTWEFVL